MIPELDLIHVGDCLEIMRGWPDRFVQTVVTSPPYWGLRDYGVAGQIGLEETPEAYVAKMVEVFREVRRILNDDGTLWLNMGDSYTSGGRSTHGTRIGYKQETNGGSMAMQFARPEQPAGLKPKDLIGMPWRFAFALQADGWYLRSDIIWAKPNPMPESVTDRPTKAHEYLFLMAKSERYFYDADSIKEPGVQEEWANGFRGGAYLNGTTFANDEGGKRRYRGNFKMPSANGKHKIPTGWDTRKGSHNELLGRYKPLPDGQANIREKRDKQRGHGRRHAGFNDRWDEMEREEQCSGMRNKRDVWTVATSPFPDAHFATFPTALIKPCILAGSRAKDIVFDPFIGAGTTALVAAAYGRRFLGIELNPEYAALAERRIAIELSQVKMAI
jgi:DNA modification methylase